MKVVLTALLLFLTACAAPQRDGPRMTSVVSFEPERFAGAWHEIAAVGGASGARWQVGAPGSGGQPVRRGTERFDARHLGDGQMRLSDRDGRVFVLWVDEGYRTLVLGTPDHSFAVILDRAAAIAPDRLRAAQEILAWNGYPAGAVR